MDQNQSANNLGNTVKNTILILLGIVSAAFGLKGFLLSSHFIDGGVTGISMLLSAAFGLPLAILILVINLPFIVLGYKQMGMRFTLKSAAAIAGLSLALVVVEFPDVTHDKLLTAVFGGVFIGSGIGLAMRGGAVLDGTEIAALIVSKNYPLKVSDFILLLNILIFLSAMLVLGTETALYSILTYFAASKMIEFFIQGIEQYTGVTIVSEHSEKIRQAVTENLGRGVTIYQGKRGFGKRGTSNVDIDIVFTVVTRFELPDLKKEVKQIDPNAFLFQHSIDDTEGGMVKRRPLH
ncbi:membrane protein [Rufibacter sp. DG15C]|uniref:YitT family protein n=1 Tax=Rufibacter sp. DG15C TaxID=1379909 RepID=UPI00078DA4BA|nr:YitT family protein [Rufibacter sp. DG15C]AMM51575.1 membrane protein [Rufibacter sp. DG15C]